MDEKGASFRAPAVKLALVGQGRVLRAQAGSLGGDSLSSPQPYGVLARAWAGFASQHPGPCAASLARVLGMQSGRVITNHFGMRGSACTDHEDGRARGRWEEALVAF